MSTIPPRCPRADELHDAHWRRSSYSGGANDCVEIADLGAYAAVRDSKAPDLSPVILSRSALGDLLAHCTDGETWCG
ncbi:MULTISPECIES: DUF397 domain-containing protein [Streptomyces]|uniref:DUF397 domain-containing protein n=1 Tax=Streptomyces TaxID=1883 RepID=UPI0006C36480|nr:MULTISPECIES: DUF397 domain-containing protein [unclassified Streptomyces]KOX45832.1 hypothetical protein ADL09_20810 [Streptomyces sp. NRRL F-7442]